MPLDTPLASRLTDDFLRVSRRRLETRVVRIECCLVRLSDEQIWTRRHDIENAVGNLVLHLCGNITQWIIGGVGGETMSRDRDAEFARREPVPAPELVAGLRVAVEQADAVLERLTPTDLLQPRRIQGYDVTVQHAVYHVIEHLAEHTGQIIWATKGLTGEDLRFFAYLDDENGARGRDP
ncbi:MAG: hypothetical protein CL482_01085 [Acidobacteria bacterium]|nr:hypothetical protein [Acidobacteriota bacterium]